ncbi:hypothetical protein PUNSTDRAFT_146568 [Punctularia strigosozonata HHB-11173 SS5]|uniref:C3H1-type domain-containing protein n=1 Tax=Punctularia strigosozonata (strain HHB-11173) TaxID=741275 RepID=R7S3B4_PUNST|nr:uncharacterized protein PUNSTDRAFT_146568 [Punctularia strigosozonata HHB-11173 SS5]EIN04349.1 hypothetical protein PUNSTDRAFT_146568 [Punctularia strigosozonata HHB-11173 SS5]
MAAAYLKQENYVLTERCTDKTLLHEPRLLKARYRRGIARKGLGMVKGAMRDFELCLEQDPKCMEAKHELADARKLFESGDYDSESDPEDPIYDSELGYTSDSSDFRHEGNGTPCKFYNHNGCKKGAKKCPFKHGPDNRSMRDDLGRNVCLFYLLGDCKFDDEDCFYAHSKLYLPPSGWWNKPEKIEQYLEMLDMAYEFSGTTPGQMMDGFLGRMLNGDLRDNGKKFIESLDDETNFTDLGPSPDMSRNKPRKKGGKPKKGKGKGVRPRDPSLEREVEERQRNCGFTDDEVYELALQGVKPWDDDAWDVLDVLNGNF